MNFRFFSFLPYWTPIGANRVVEVMTIWLRGCRSMYPSTSSKACWRVSWDPTPPPSQFVSGRAENQLQKNQRDAFQRCLIFAVIYTLTCFFLQVNQRAPLLGCARQVHTPSCVNCLGVWKLFTSVTHFPVSNRITHFFTNF